MEHSFVEMLQAAGSGADQELVRLRNPDSRHCRWLEKDPWACGPCRFSPLNGPNGKTFRSIAEYPDLLDDAFRLMVCMQARLVDPDEMTTAELEMLCTMHREKPVHKAKLFADLITAGVAQLFSGHGVG